ncbi:MAG: tRNA (N6-threonylcarbamoyladenosine(37)-N6)-methyltransferase TrmO [Clostridia bacterium]|nr:tRNA (N6-threonylcarbamoyladenosine(37)-N6)-methyltransferase TrmO [Clostridia bacterium]
MKKTEIEPIGYIRTDFKEKFGIPRQSGRAPSLQAEIIFCPEYRNADMFRGIEGFSHLWLLFDFSLTREKGWSATVRPPRLGGNTRVGVFASRSPFRPNHIGLSCVKLEAIRRTQEYGTILIVSGADLLDGTPVFDVKPYLPLADCIPQASGGYSEQGETHKLTVVFPEPLLSEIPPEKRAGLQECLADDPRPAYKDEPNRLYGISFGGFNIRFTVDKDTLTVQEIQP